MPSEGKRRVAATRGRVAGGVGRCIRWGVGGGGVGWWCGVVGGV